MRTNLTFDTERLHEQDRHWIHPWEDIKALPNAERTIIAQAEGIYLHDSDGNRLIDGPAGMWCVNIGHGRRGNGPGDRRAGHAHALLSAPGAWATCRPRNWRKSWPNCRRGI